MACYGINIRTKDNHHYYFQIDGSSRVHATHQLVKHPDYIAENIAINNIAESSIVVVVGNIVKPQGLIKSR